jgi:O-methyltransferase
MKNRYLHRLYGNSRLARVISMGIMARFELMSLGGHKSKDVLDLIRTTRQQRESLLSGTEAFLVHSIARAQSNLDGSMAEVGVYQGCSAKLISVASAGRTLHLFDTFDGLPEPDPAERKHLRKSQYCSSLSSVRSFLDHESGVIFHPGCFPSTAAGLEDERFSFVHLDVDLKASTRACLEFFHPRMVPGGIIMTHDYSFLDGVREAFAEFLVGRAGQLIELPTSQALLVCAGIAAPVAHSQSSFGRVQETIPLSRSADRPQVHGGVPVMAMTQNGAPA